MRILLLILSVSGWSSMVAKAEVLETVAQWPLIDFALPYDRTFQQQFRPENTVPTGIEIGWNRIFISIPRLRQGVPATLSYIPRNLPKGSSPQLQAYPSWDWHLAGRGDLNCSRLISVYRTRLDRCNRLWVLDGGVVTSIDDFRPVCPPKLLVFDMQTDRLVRQIVFPREVLRPNSLLTNLIIDETQAKTCDDVFVYMTDTAGPGVLVFDGRTDRSWRLLHSTMFPDPDHGRYTIEGDSFEFMDGIVGFAFSPRLATVYYQPLATDRIFSVPTSALQRGPLAEGETLPVTTVGRKSSQGLPLAVDTRDDSLLFAPFTETTIASWQPQTNNQRIVAYSAQELQFTAEIRAADRDDGTIWVMSTRFQKFFMRRASSREINIRIMRLRPEDKRNPIAVQDQFLSSLFPSYYYNNTLGFL